MREHGYPYIMFHAHTEENGIYMAKLVWQNGKIGMAKLQTLVWQNCKLESMQMKLQRLQNRAARL